MAGMLLMIAGGIVTTLASSFETVLCGRILGGIGRAILIMLMSKMVFDWFTDKARFFFAKCCATAPGCRFVGVVRRAAAGAAAAVDPGARTKQASTQE
jgi:hypothetical protein